MPFSPYSERNKTSLIIYAMFYAYVFRMHNIQWEREGERKRGRLMEWIALFYVSQMSFRGILLICHDFYDDCINFLCYHHQHISMMNSQTQIKYNIAAHFIMRFISSHNSYAKVMKTGKVEDDWVAIQPTRSLRSSFPYHAVWQKHSIDEHIRLIGHNPSWDFRWLFFLSQVKT